ncbi:MAG: aminotransferase class IV [Chryseosolibacter sp.]
MSRLLESIKLLDGKFYNLFYHEQRMKQSLNAVFGDNTAIALERYLQERDYPVKGLYKCRIEYDQHSRETTFIPYAPKKISRVRIIEDDLIAYRFKFANRDAINRLFALRGECDDVMIISNGLVTDCSFSNIVFRKAQDWFTPSTPLLNGTMRQNLLEKNKIMLREIRRDEVRSFDTFKIINAMLEFDSPEIEVSQIVF